MTNKKIAVVVTLVCLLIIGLIVKKVATKTSSDQSVATNLTPINEPSNILNNAQQSCTTGADGNQVCLTQVKADISNAPPPGASSNSSAASSNDDSLAAHFPNLEAVREQVAKDPHTTPEAVQKFAHLLSKRMEGALVSEEKAKQFLPELKSCATNVKVTSVAALCAWNANRLGDRFLSLKKESDNLTNSLPKEVKILLQEF